MISCVKLEVKSCEETEETFFIKRTKQECKTHKLKRREYGDFRPILHKYANEDVSLGSWLIGLEVEHIDERRMCCGTPPGKQLVDCILFVPSVYRT